jgi:hypothetical protein
MAFVLDCVGTDEIGFPMPSCVNLPDRFYNGGTKYSNG